MRLPTEQLASQLARELKPLYTVFGDEPLLALEAGDRIRAKARAEGYDEREVLTADSSFKWPQLAMAANSQSLFASRKLLDLRIPNGKPGVEGSAALQTFCKSLPADTITLIYLPEIDWRAQKAGWFEALDHAGMMVEAKAVPRKALPQWLAARLKAQGQDADAEALAFIADRVEGNLMAAFQEVQKLALLFPPGPISFEQIREAVLDVAGSASNGAGVDQQDCKPGGRGSAELCSVWEDPDFDPTQSAFYYARVLENPSCRWTTYQCQAAGVNPFADDCAAQADAADVLAHGAGATGPVYGKCCLKRAQEPFYSPVIQERAWTSPVWYLPPTP